MRRSSACTSGISWSSADTGPRRPRRGAAPSHVAPSNRWRQCNAEPVCPIDARFAHAVHAYRRERAKKDVSNLQPTPRDRSIVMKQRPLLLIAGAVIAWTSLTLHAARRRCRRPRQRLERSRARPCLIASGLQGASGSAIGPGGASVSSPRARSGRILRVDPRERQRSRCSRADCRRPVIPGSAA